MKALTLFAIFLIVFQGCSSSPSQPPQGAEFKAKEGSVQFFMGQDSDTLSEYHKEVLAKDPTMPYPYGITLYTNIVVNSPTDPVQPLDGLLRRGNWGAGAVHLDKTLELYPNAAVAIGLYISDGYGPCQQIPTRAIAGESDFVGKAKVKAYHKEVDKMINKLASLNRPVYLRIGYEFDGPWNCYKPETYKKAFRFIAKRIKELKADQVFTVWQTAAWPLNENVKGDNKNFKVSDPNHLNKWYPGDDVVDWIGLSTFYGATYKKYQWSCKQTDVEPREFQDRVLSFAKNKDKPVFVAEASPQGFSVGEKTSSCVYSRNEKPIAPEELWDTWYKDWFDYIEQNQDIIKAVAYINTNWMTQPIWGCKGKKCPNGYWGDSRIHANELILERFRDKLNSGTYSVYSQQAN